jgi:phosphoribosylglycinamide formyltransferase 1
MAKILPIAVLISGGGTTLRNLIYCRDQGTLPIDFRIVISSRKDAAGLKFAEDSRIPTAIVAKQKSQSADEHAANMFDLIRGSGAYLVVMAGYLQHVMIPPDFENRVINIHPSLIPAFCGQGMYGLRVHQAAIDFGVRISGCTVHFVDNEYDHGPIILQRACPVFEEDTAVSLQQRVFELECIALPDAIRQIATDYFLTNP